jgi:hypothetical protein
VLAISGDAPADSREFARDYGIGFPLLSDPDGAVSRVYTGITSDANTLPGITVIDPAGRIVFRQVASAKDDRMTANDLIATIDRTLGTKGPAVASSGYASIDRAQLRIEAGGGGQRTASDTRATAHGAIAALLPLSRYVLIGPWLGFEPREAPVDVDGAIVLRAPIFANAGALELGVASGYTPWRASGWNIAARAGIWFAVSPAWSIQLDAGIAAHRIGNATTDVFATIGVARLIRAR